MVYVFDLGSSWLTVIVSVRTTSLFALCLGATVSEKLAFRTRVKSGQSNTLEKKDEIVANAIWRFLELRGWASRSHVVFQWR